MVTSRDVAQAAGVSQATVSRAMSGSTRVSEDVRERVLEAATRLEYEPNLAARAMRTRRSGSIGVVVERVTNPFYPQIIEQISRRLADYDLKMLLWDSAGAGEQSAIQAIRRKQVDGLVFTTATATSKPLRAALDAGAPVALVNRVVDGAQADQVESHNEQMSAKVAAYFAQAGRVRVGLITATEEASTARRRRRGFVAGAAEHGLRLPQARILDGAFSHAGGAEALTRMMRSRHPPEAVFCANDLSAFGALDAARTLGVKVPEDLWVVGYDDIDMASWSSFDLTTVCQPIDEMVNFAVDLLLRRIDDPQQPYTHRLFDGSLEVRGSTGHVAVAGH